MSVQSVGLYTGPTPPRLPVEPSAQSNFGKGGVFRLIDIAVALVALIFFLPVMVLIALAIYAQDRGPVVFAHQRLGQNGRRFPCLKFRSMVNDADRVLRDVLSSNPAMRAEWDRDHKLRDDPRITPLGNFLRRTSLDELPQLINILRGDMSLVGPRPIVEGEIPRYGRYIRNYYSVRPGLTGIWQVSGRSNVTYRRRVAMDVVYARCASLGLNIRILLATVPAVLTSRGSC
ncbi:sugar transferase [Stakelama sediminis]|uniref:Lipopolysaccharide/colanic/teichoic acid biosynthesis glycosyltransferase n=1 Tax=Stakelama sediminis TaxID=463200 RepID=A0A840Z1U5_9SPHN|nr:sugar transferase [Stakelama sediminis]MBB5719968.1 lipopolysaccharide/colanic/teichoic acid biosynthesis glycosyltransferase [Stakelama sediminis]